MSCPCATGACHSSSDAIPGPLAEAYANHIDWHQATRAQEPAARHQGVLVILDLGHRELDSVEVIRLLLQHPGMMLSQQQLLAEVWAPATPGLRTTSGSTSHSCIANWSLTQPAALAAHGAWHGLSLSARAAGRVTANSRRAADRGS